MFKVRHTIIRSALVLTLANIITRLLGFFYRIFMSNAIGAEGMGLYQLISPVYMLVWAFSSAGISTSVSRLTAREKGRGRGGNIRLITLAACGVSLSLSLVASAVVYLGAPYICTYLLKDNRTLLSMRILSLCFPFMALGSCIRGRFYGLEQAGVPARCQVLEQCSRMAVVYILSFSMLEGGLEEACAMAVIGMAVGEVVSCIYAFLCVEASGDRRVDITYMQALSMLGAMALPLTLNRLCTSLLSSVESFLIPTRLELYGMTRSEAVSLYGQLCGMAMPLVMFPSSLLTALATALMPAVSKAEAGGRQRDMASAVEKSLILTMVVGIGTGGIFLALPNELAGVIYSGEDIGDMLRLLAFVCPFIYLQVTLSGVLNGLGKQVFIFLAGLLSSLGSIGAVWFLLPMWGIRGYVAVWLMCTVGTVVFSLRVVSRCIPLRLYLNNMLLKPLGAMALTCMSLKMLTKGVELTSLPALFAALAFAGGMYLALVVMMRVFGRDGGR